MLCSHDWGTAHTHPWSADIDPLYNDYGNGYIPFFAVIGAGNELFYGENSISVLNSKIQTAINSFNMIQVQNPIADKLLSNQSALQIDISNVFVDPSGKPITITLDNNSNPTTVSAELSGMTLTLNYLQNGIATVKLKATTTDKSVYTEFKVKAIEAIPVSGYGTCYNLNGNSYIYAGDNSILNDVKKLTVEAWVKIDEMGNNGIIQKSRSTVSGWYLTATSANKLKFLINTDSGARKNYSTTALDLDTWYHIAVTYDGDDANIYINGLLDKTKHYDEVLDIKNDDTGLIIGNAGGYILPGSLDEVKLWNRALSNQEIIENLYTETNPSESNLIGYWKFEEGIGSSVADETGNNNGSIQSTQIEYWENTENSLIYYVNKSTASLSGNLLGSSIYSSNLTFAIAENNCFVGTIFITDPVTGAFTYTLSGNEGEDTFTYTVNDDIGTSVTQKVKIFVTDGVGMNNTQMVNKFELSQNYPNPFNPTTTITFNLAQNTNVKLSVFNTKGEVVANLINNALNKGIHNVNFDASKLNSGVYYYKLETADKSMVQKMLLVK